MVDQDPSTLLHTALAHPVRHVSSKAESRDLQRMLLLLPTSYIYEVCTYLSSYELSCLPRVRGDKVRYVHSMYLRQHLRQHRKYQVHSSYCTVDPPTYIRYIYTYLLTYT
jgi:hypothetical protein